MPFIAVNSIVVEERIRGQSAGSIEDLAASIARWGLMHPITVMRDSLVLVAGWRRLQAHVLLELPEIEVKFRDELNEDEALELELEENLQREDISWQEEVLARRRLHELKVKLYGTPGSTSSATDKGWRLEDTAESLGLKKPQVHRDIQLANALESDIGGVIAKIPTKEKAAKVLKNLAEKQILRTIAKKEKQKREEAEARGEAPPDTIQLIHGDCTKVIRKISDESMDLVISDPPFGIGDELLQSGEGSQGIRFSNKPQESLDLYTQTVQHMYRILKPGTHCYLFFAIQFYQPIRDLCESVGFDVRHMPLVWVKESGGRTDIDWKFPPSYEVIFFMQKHPGRPLGKQVNRDTFVINREHTSKRIHPMERPRALIKELLEISSNPGDLIFDPFSGSFVVPYMCKLMDRRCVAVEKDEDHYNGGVARLGVAETELTTSDIDANKLSATAIGGSKITKEKENA